MGIRHILDVPIHIRKGKNKVQFKYKYTYNTDYINIYSLPLLLNATRLFILGVGPSK